MTVRRREQPLRRVNPSGRVVWVARFTDSRGKRHSAGTFPLRREAQEAILAAYEVEHQRPRQIGTVAAYAEHWQRMHPRAPSSARTYAHNLRAALRVEVGGKPLAEWCVDELERPEMAELLDHLLRVDGRAANGARSILRTLSAMFEDAITDGWSKRNPA